MEGGIGPVAGSSHHALYYRMPGTNIASPMTSGEYDEAYEWFMANDEVLYMSEHRGSYGNTEELPDILVDNARVVLFPISITRFAAVEAAEQLNEMGISTSVIHLPWIKPLKIRTEEWAERLGQARMAMVIDDDYEDGVARAIAHKLMLHPNAMTPVTRESTPVYTLGLENRAAGFSKETDNLPPTAEKIVQEVVEKWQEL